MSRKKNAGQKLVEPGQGLEGTTATPAGDNTFWPADFRPPRQAVYAAGGFAAFSVLLFSLASVNGLLWLKRIVGAIVGLSAPVLEVSAESWDIAAVIWLFSFIATAAWVHPVLGIGALLLLRTPLDGYVYPTDNSYFLWAIGGLCVAWVWKMRRAGRHPSLPVAFWVLVAFVLVAAATGSGSIIPDHSYRALMLWIGYVLLLWLSFHCAREGLGARWIIAGLIAAAAMQAYYSVLHFEYVLPYLRHMIATSREARLQFFGEDTLSPERIRRFNVNRAFGSMLFSNSLAGFLILSIPLIGAAALASVQKLRTLPDEAQTPQKPAGKYTPVACAGFAWVILSIAAGIAVEFRVVHAIRPLHWLEQSYVLGGVVCLLALLPAIWVYGTVARGPWSRAGAVLGAAGLPLVFLMTLYTLWITYSRGAMLALLLAALATAALLVLRRTPWLNAMLPRFAAIILVTLGVAGTIHGLRVPEASAQEAAPQAAPATPPPAEEQAIENRKLLEEGMDVSAQQLMNPESFRLRLTYWNVGWRMFLANPISGVGLGNFGPAYPRYQYFGAADVKEAHNGFLQIFSETGLIGGLLFTAFWAIILVVGALRLLRAPGGPDLAVSVGLYMGLLAFLIHAAVDIHFSHPSLVMIALVFTSVFLARMPGAAPGAKAFARGPMGFVAVPLAGAILLAAFSLPPYIHDLALSRMSFINVDGTIGDRDISLDMSRRVGAAQVLLDAGPKFKASQNNKQAPQLTFVSAMDLIPNEKNLTSVGAVYVPVPAGEGMRKLDDTEPIPQNAVLVVQRPWDAFGFALEGAKARVAELERIDRRYPRSPQLATHIAQWCELMTRHSIAKKFDAMRLEYADKMLAWAEEAVARSPLTADSHGVLAFMCWAHANANLSEGRMQKVQRCIEEYERAAALSPLTTDYLKPLARVLEQLAATPSGSVSAEDKAKYAQRAAAVHARIAEINQQRIATGMVM